MSALFSCVVPVKGARPFLQEALSSLSRQGLDDDLEIIIQDGDAEPDAGQSDALNKGFAKAHGEWLFWLNADDLLLPGALAAVRSKIRKAESQGFPLEWITGNQLLIDDAGRVLKCSVGHKWHDWLYRHAVPHVYGPSSFFKRELFKRVGGVNASLFYCMDWDLWIKFMKAGARFERMNDYIWAQRQWIGSKTQREMPFQDQEKFEKEIRSMLTENGLSVTASGLFLYRAWRLFNGNYVREGIDTFMMKGKCVV